MPKLVWNPKQTRNVVKPDGYRVTIKRRRVLVLIEGRWRGIPANYRAWTFVVREQDDGLKPLAPRWRKPDKVNGLGVWVPKVGTYPRPDVTLD